MLELTFTVSGRPDELLSRTDQDPLRDPHHIPKFNSGTSRPILYLPPLLSSLPASYQAAQGPFLYPPLITKTRLPDIDPASLSLHRALHHFRPVDDQYAARPYSEAFNWDQIQLPEEDGRLCTFRLIIFRPIYHPEREWYCVAFRSLRKGGSDGNGEFYEMQFA